ncbi:MAG: MBL fold metallo-hydrolase [Candidatus Hodarchaeales archaeon]|jgi:glyoxylase-like metal-dependent hydrolase (beta-lactamase superfamily II)
MKQITKDISWLLGQGFDSNVFIIESDTESLMIDTGTGKMLSQNLNLSSSSFDQFKQAIQKKNITKIFLTHGHLDHVGGIMSIQTEIDLTVYASEIESKHLISGNRFLISPIMNSPCDPVNISEQFREGDRISVGKYNFRIFETPGHTEGSVSLYDDKKLILISGDTVFPQGSFGRTDMLTGSSAELLKSLERLSELEVRIFLPGHMPPIVSPTPISAVKDSYRNAQMMLSYY